jgi:phosphoglycolate phosphatase-like HAD superfamily hydrolase
LSSHPKLHFPVYFFTFVAMKFKTIIFDLDGTLANTLPLCIAAFRKSIEPLLQKSITDREIIENFGPSEEGTIRKMIPEHEVAGIEAYLKHYADLHYTCPIPFAGIIELLDFLTTKNVQLAMVTGKGIHSTKISLDKFGLTKYFDVMETGSADGPNKVKGIRKVLNRLNTDINDSLYIGDAPSDIIYCKEIGISIGAAAWAETTDPKQLLTLKPNWIFYTVAEFRAWISNH